MDTFFEQIVAVKKTGGQLALSILIWFSALIISAVLFIVGPRIPFFGFFSFLIIVGIFYGAYKLSSRFNIEYEYIITNGSMDIDRIVNKSSRKRMLSFELSGVTRIEKFNPSLLRNINEKSVMFACEQDNPGAYLMVCEKENGPSSYLVFTPDDRIKGAVIKFVPKFVSNSAFK